MQYNIINFNLIAITTVKQSNNKKQKFKTIRNKNTNQNYIKYIMHENI